MLLYDVGYVQQSMYSTLVVAVAAAAAPVGTLPLTVIFYTRIIVVMVRVRVIHDVAMREVHHATDWSSRLSAHASQIVTHADESRGSKAFIRVSLCVCLSAR